MDGRCVKHQFELATDTCRHCGHEYCEECLVYSFGRNEPPFCVSCALAAAGVRSNAARRPALSRRELRRQTKLRRKAERQRAAEAARGTVDVRPMEVDWSGSGDARDSGSDWVAERFPESHGERIPF